DKKGIPTKMRSSFVGLKSWGVHKVNSLKTCTASLTEQGMVAPFGRYHSLRSCRTPINWFF
ncbi:hypothetical protein JXM67_04880, partial [candidate division WOR-3 bacterium]|nr:hypothetical protein [candidate division WOR-3 bacterium]